jgi:Rieske 2Fe-2S family protein
MELAPDAETMSMSGESDGVLLPGLDDAQAREVVYVGLFPNFLVSLHPDYVMTHRIEPVSPGVSAVECEWLFAPEAVARADFDPAYAVDFWDVTNRQDWTACENVQRGLSSRGFHPGPLGVDEDAVQRFTAMVARGYLGRPLDAGVRRREGSV